MTSAAYGSRTAESVLPPTWGDVKKDATITSLQESAYYHWRVVVKTSSGIAYGVDHVFATAYYLGVDSGEAEVGTTEATLTGEVESVGEEAKYYYEYGPTEAYGLRTAEANVESGKGHVKVSAVLPGLAPGTLYHFRIVASNGHRTATGDDRTFTTRGGKPAVETLPAEEIGYTEAAVVSTIDAKGVETKFYFEYGTTSKYEQRSYEQSIEYMTAYKEGAFILGLTPGNTYHFRIVATNSYGTTYGADQTFSTRQAPLVETKSSEATGYDDATLSGVINPRGTQIDYYFEYGTSLTYGKRTSQSAAGSGTNDVQELQTVNGLAEDTNYHFRMVATNSYGTFYGADQAFATGIRPFVQTNPPLASLPEVVGPPPTLTPLAPIIIGPPQFPAPAGPPHLNLSLHVAQHGNSLLVMLKLDRRATRVDVDATVPEVQLGTVKPRDHRAAVVLARTVHTNVEAGQSKLVLPLDAQGRRALRHRRHLTLTLNVIVTASSGEQTDHSRTFTIASVK